MKVSPVSTLQEQIQELLHAMTCREPHPINYDFFCEYRDVEIPKATQSLLKEISNLISSAQPEKKDRSWPDDRKAVNPEAHAYNQAIEEYHTNIMGKLK